MSFTQMDCKEVNLINRNPIK